MSIENNLAIGVITSICFEPIITAKLNDLINVTQEALASLTKLCMKYSTMAEATLSIQATFLYQVTQHEILPQALTKLS